MVKPQLLHKEIIYPIKDRKTVQCQYGYAVPQKPSVVMEYVKELSITIKNGMSKLGKKAQIFMSYFYDSIGRWIDCQGVQAGVAPKLYDPAEEYENFTGAPLTAIKHFDIVIMEIPTKGGIDNDNNDCLFDALFHAYQNDKDTMPSQIDTAAKLKKFLGVGRKQLVDVKLIGKLDDICKGYAIYVTGDYTFTSKKTENLHIKLNLHDGHYNLKPRGKSECRPNTQKTLIVYELQGKKYALYDGVKHTECTSEELKLLKKTNCVMPINKRKKTDSIETNWKAKQDERDELMKATNNKMDLFHYRSIFFAVGEAFRLRSEVMTEPEDIDQLEAQFIDGAFQGGLMYSDDGFTGHLYGYDANSKYSSTMINKRFHFPVKKGKFSCISQKEFDEYKFCSYGIYRCIVAPSNDISKDMFFRFNDRGYYTHIDLEVAKRLDLNITMCCDDEANILLYDRSTLVQSHRVFSKFVNYFYKIKHSTPKTNIAKQIVSRLWGMMCQKSIRTKMFTNDKPKVLKENEITVSIKPTPDRQAFEVSISDTNKIFDSNYARIAPFLTATARRDLYNDFGGYGTHIKRIHTDGVMCTVPITTLIMGTDIGMYKQDKDGVYTLKNINRVLEGHE